MTIIKLDHWGWCKFMWKPIYWRIHCCQLICPPIISITKLQSQICVGKYDQDCNRNDMDKINYDIIVYKNSTYWAQFNKKIDCGMHPKLMDVVSKQIQNY